jgi:hypothetical protein
VEEIAPDLRLVPGDLLLSGAEQQLSFAWASSLDRQLRAFRVTATFATVAQRAATWAPRLTTGGKAGQTGFSAPPIVQPADLPTPPGGRVQAPEVTYSRAASVVPLAICVLPMSERTSASGTQAMRSDSMPSAGSPMRVAPDAW